MSPPAGVPRDQEGKISTREYLQELRAILDRDLSSAYDASSGSGGGQGPTKRETAARRLGLFRRS